MASLYRENITDIVSGGWDQGIGTGSIYFDRFLFQRGG